jgi:hypothetical protein
VGLVAVPPKSPAKVINPCVVVVAGGSKYAISICPLIDILTELFLGNPPI